MKLPIPASELIPHRGSMLLIDAFVFYDTGIGRATATVRQGNIMLESGGHLARLASVELIAQTYAALHGWELKLKGIAPTFGYLVGVQSYESLQTAAAGDELEIEVRNMGEFENFAVVEGSVSRADTVLARAKIKLWAPDEDAL